MEYKRILKKGINTMIKAQYNQIASYLPVFNGFYNTIWQYEDENEIYFINEERKENGLNPIEYDNIEIDYKEYEKDICLKLCEVLSERLKPFVQSITMQEIISPKEYNFKNDSVNVLIVADVEAIRQYIYANIEDYKTYLKNIYTPCDGYMPFYSNNFEDWKEYTQDFSDFSANGHYLGSVLEFIAQREEITEYEINEDVKADIFKGNYISNYDEVMNGLTCSKCNAIIKDEKILSDVKKYKSITEKNPSVIHCENCID